MCMLKTRLYVFHLIYSTPTKFSRHLIFKLQNAAFKNNIHAGNFVHHIMDNLMHITSIDSSNHTSTNDLNGISHETPITDGNGLSHDPPISNRNEPSLNSPMGEGNRPSLDTQDCNSNEISCSDRKQWTGAIPLDSLRKLVVHDKHGNNVLFCDLGNY